ncbi:MAG: AraC family transcriptional regulator [Acidimicrobiia bacterium]
MSPPPSLERVRAWKPSVPGIREVFHARFVDHAYPRHTHDTWTLFIVDQGMIRYELARRDHGALPPMVTVLPPGVVHDGRPVSGDGFRKRVLYLETSLLGEHLTGRAVDRPVIRDLTLRRRVSAVHRLLASTDDAFQAEIRLSFIAERIRFHFGQRSEDGPWMAADDLAEAFRAYIDGHLFEPVTLAAAGHLLGANPTHLARCFTRAFGIAPHTYLLGRRIDAARQRLLEGQPPADVAVSVGFYDQAHFTRHFKRHTGTAPGRFRSQRIPIRSE